MLSSLFFLAVGSAILFVGSEWLIDAAKAIARKLRFSDFVIGLTVVAIGTSFPELVVGIISALGGYSEFVMGNVLGSNVANIGLALGLPALFYSVKFQLSDIKTVIVYNILACVYLYFTSLDNMISTQDSLGLLLIFSVFMFGRIFRASIDVEPSSDTQVSGNIFPSLVRLLAGGMCLYWGSELFINNGAAPLVRQFGFSEKAVGMTVVAIGTSLPEVFVTMVALSKKEVGISLGNIIGSNILNIVFVLGVVGLINPIVFSNINFELFYGLILVFLLLPLSLFFGGLNRSSGILLLLLYTIFLYLQFS
ncbi:MAG: sodium:calcium antiporter [Candidatus Neomarinimicrobiota bacterium]|nr:sodium:calcium antiporter [Candidatus Neomarinimicrobiota bacterium]MEC9455204.1 sodium:calcium antiporter [Candidatus Neomarinimicrobiota bacterium]MED5451378.1 sodium:calcium antiporter [Candidatus Neomarinimicrobiota bacterium]MEE3241521.1 sodium:calcium antiporter [Candidatus Neomarinimicrobiota bacterium]MEE3302048.1 sodium:calcium antiporter [Candidatus Neomarinimicrobiota bacterium]